ncbi:MAG TPA: putative glycoside hydrolase [Clostridia bacterium]
MRTNIVKRFALSFLIGIMSVSFAACGTKDGQQNNQASSAKSSTNISTTTPPAATAATTSQPSNSDTQFQNADKPRVQAKGMYLTATSAGARLKHYIDLANTTEINSYVIDYKDDDGYVCIDSKVPLAKEVKAIDVRYDAQKVVKELHDNHIYAIARIVCFKDPFLSKGRPDMAIKKKDGSVYVHDGKTWVNPYNHDAWQYNIDLAKEALAAGFDEVQFDYIRFPDGKKTDMAFGDTGGKKMNEEIEAFLAEARKQMPTAILSGDVFAIICETPGDLQAIGQVWEEIGKNLDYVCPMSYPSHYALGQIINNVKFPKPDLEPYSLIKNAYTRAQERLAKVEGHKPMIRGYLQDFTATWIGKGNYQHYGDEQVRQQIQGLKDAGINEWFLWDPMNSYEEGALAKK